MCFSWRVSGLLQHHQRKANIQQLCWLQWKNISFYAIKFKINCSRKTTPLRYSHGLPWWLSGWKSPCQCRRHRFDPTSLEATKPICHNYWAGALECGNCKYWAHAPQLSKPVGLRACAPPPTCSKRVAPALCNHRTSLTARITQHRQK